VLFGCNLLSLVCRRFSRLLFVSLRNDIASGCRRTPLFYREVWRRCVFRLKGFGLNYMWISWAEDPEMTVVTRDYSKDSSFMPASKFSFEISHEVTDECFFVSI
jgi:hypothetical protein